MIECEKIECPTYEVEPVSKDVWAKMRKLHEELKVKLWERWLKRNKPV